MTSLFPYKGLLPTVHPSCFIAPNAAITGDTHIGANSSVWYNVSIRGDVMPIRIGEGTNVQDNAVIHVTQGKFGTTIGNHVTIGHGAIIHACTIGDYALVGMGAIVLDGAVVEPHAFVAAGAVVTPGKVVPSGYMWMGAPGKAVRELTADEKAYLLWSGPHYVSVAQGYK
ncbi:MAG TPA: gamma carbonic anhydrase family protein [Alphaproteobacteria bacterium]|nr:gamma carbonic anhydrase family protein [Alphaproteobacteria bacterium]